MFRLSWFLLLTGFAVVNGKASDASESLHIPRTAGSHCNPFLMVFNNSTSRSDFERDFDPLSPPGSYSLDSDGLKLFLDKPDGEVKVAEGATFNSTFTVRYGKVTYTFSGPAVSGVVSAAILTAPEGDQIDTDLVGGDPSHWQTNAFAPASQESQPLNTTFSAIQDYPQSPKNVSSTHAYTIDWSPDRIVWSVDGTQVRTLSKDDMDLHYPSNPTRLQFGIAESAHGPVDWNTAPERMNAVFESIKVECPY